MSNYNSIYIFFLDSVIKEGRIGSKSINLKPFFSAKFAKPGIFCIFRNKFRAERSFSSGLFLLMKIFFGV